MSEINTISYQELNTAHIRHRKYAERGVRLCILVLGERGIGKSTFLNNLCNKKIFPIVQDSETLVDVPQSSPTIKLFTETVQLNEDKSAPITLDIVLFPGCGDQIDNSKTPDQIREYLDDQFDAVLNEELRIKRNRGDLDNRPHVCIYFIRATSRGLGEFDIQIMKELESRVNIIPVLAKADLLTEEELKLNKELVMRDINTHQIRIFDFKDDRLVDSLLEVEDGSSFNSGRQIYPATLINDMLPFSVVCSDDEIISVNGAANHTRKYEWGNVIVENGNHSDFIYLKGILLGSHLQELKDVTNEVFYENYRTKMLLDKKVLTEYMPDAVTLDSNEKCGSIVGARRRNAFSVSAGNHSPHVTVKSDDSLNCKELEEKNSIIKAYQRRIDALEGILKGTSVTLSPDSNAEHKHDDFQ